jgi:hypothetical protein
MAHAPSFSRCARSCGNGWWCRSCGATNLGAHARDGPAGASRAALLASRNRQGPGACRAVCPSRNSL